MSGLGRGRWKPKITLVDPQSWFWTEIPHGVAFKAGTREATQHRDQRIRSYRRILFRCSSNPYPPFAVWHRDTQARASKPTARISINPSGETVASN